MGETEVLLGKISALRQRLEQVQGLATQAGSAASALTNDIAAAPAAFLPFEAGMTDVAQAADRFDAALRRAEPAPERLPTQLTGRARRILERGGDLLERLKGMSPQFQPVPERESGPDLLGANFRETVSMTDAVLRLLGALPDVPSVQLRLCAGLDSILDAVGDRVERLAEALVRRRHEAARLDVLVEMLRAFPKDEVPAAGPVLALAEELREDAGQGAPIRFVDAGAAEPAHFIAGHALVVAQVVARLIRHEADWQRNPIQPILAALVHDAGMMVVSPAILVQREPLDDAQRRTIEGHAYQGALWVARLFPADGGLAEAAADHHERLDGTGYPAGLLEAQQSPLSRLLAVCDVYAAFCAPRPYRAAREPRTALTDTLLMAEKGLLDRFEAERLLRLSFYPIGSVVELADGAVGVVVGIPSDGSDLSLPGRPVVALLADSERRLLASPRHLDLAHCDGHSIVRTLPADERRKLFGRRHPELAA